jgi:hypothetical protein
MPTGRLAYNFRRRLIVDAFVRDIPGRRLRSALHNDALYALVDGAARVVLVQFLAPHAGQLGLRGQGIHGGVNPNNSNSDIETEAALDAARSLGMKLLVQRAGDERAIDAAFADLAQQQTPALVIGSDAYFYFQRRQLISLGQRY